MSRYLIGIDLGTTNSALAYVDTEEKVKKGRPKLHPFPIEQLIAPGETADRELLPSFLYLPGEHDLPTGAVAVPWDDDQPYAVGEFAREQGAKVPGRLVLSAKSWLCHAGVDRSSALLPWSAPPEVERISPVEAARCYLRHFVDAWNSRMSKGKDELRLENQEVVLTVPASFDDVARTLTVEAAQKAGIENLTLLEEPQAAFYCWLATHTDKEARQLKPGYRCVVIDVGGGTTDFSLIECVEEQGELTFVRQAVGNHLLLGGDNMDLALAVHVEGKLSTSKRLDAAQYSQLTQACRQAKESLLAPNPPESHRVSVMGRGRSIIGGALHSELTPDEVRNVIVDGFFPKTERGEMPQRGGRTGLHEMGLPYVQDPGISRHLAEFLDRHAPRPDDPDSVAPQAVLFNGGALLPEILRERVIDVMQQWFATEANPWSPFVLSNPSLNLAVALGAAQYAWLRHTGGKRIGGGIARSYYVAVDVADSSKDEDAPVSVLCVVPQKLEEGEEITLEKPELELALGEPVTFPLYSSTVRSDDQPGDLLEVQKDQLLRLPPLHTILRGGKRTGTKRVPVKLAACSTEIGTLELFCVARENDQRWRLEFNVRDVVKDEEDRYEGEQSTSDNITDVWPEELVQKGAKLIREVFAEDKPELKPQKLTQALEEALEAPKDEWPTGLCRRTWDFLCEVSDNRRRTPAHSNRWFNLVGYCLRPGFGDSLDRYRVEQLWKMLLTLGAKSGGKGPEGGAQYWITWRRVSGGLQTTYQQALFERLRPILIGGKGKGGIKPDPNELAEMWRAVASFERLESKHKEALGEALMKQLRRKPLPPYLFWALTRIGSRVPLYGPLNTVLHPEVIQKWLDQLFQFEPAHQSSTTEWAFCLSQFARRSGQRAIDVDEGHQLRALSVLKDLEIPQAWVQCVEEVVEVESEEKAQLFGDSLPIGLRLVQSEE